MFPYQQTPLAFPPYSFKLKEEGDTLSIFDEVRKKFLVLTPEEWVRQHVVQFLIQEKKVPKGLIQLEGGLNYNGLQKRSDVLVFNAAGEKVLLVECKAPSVKISQDTFDQIARYNFVHRVPWLLVSNGLTHYCCLLNWDQNSYQFVPELPIYANL
ncbi:MAG: type I restriction enzyme HsdR N-terminal domain-containing protein [Sphingobacteriales bacterium]|nr:type I restriction enzyme HsdR N-terminal domain-containing protein [Sphingobacteriales bacterium]